MPVPDFTVMSTMAAITRRKKGITSDFTTTIQCWCALTMRFSPGSSSDDIAAPTLSHLEQDDQGAEREVRAVRDRPLQRSPPDDDGDRDQPGQEHAVEERQDDRGGDGRGRRRQRAQEEAHERGELDVAESERFGPEDQGARQRKDREEQAGRDAGRQSVPP